MKKPSIILATTFLSLSLSAQIWEEKLLETNKKATTAEKIEAFENYRLTNPYVKGNGYKPYARQIDFISERVSSNRPFKQNAFYVEGCFRYSHFFVCQDENLPKKKS